MNGQNDLMKDDDETVIHTVKEFIGDDCRTSSITGILSLETYKNEKRITKSLSGCLHLCDGSGLATWSFYDTDKARLIRSAEELEKMAAYINEFAAALRANTDVVGEFDNDDSVIIAQENGKTVVKEGDKIIGRQG